MKTICGLRGVSVGSLRGRCITAALLVCSGVLATPAAAERKILQNDGFTGTAVFFQLASFDELEYGAATFTADPADYPFRIEKLQVLVLAPVPGTIALVSVTVWEELGTVEPGPALYSSSFGFQVESSDSAFNELALGCDSVVVASGSVRVGIRWEFIVDPPIGIGFDLDGITPQLNTLFSDSLGGWRYAEDESVPGDWIMRLEVETEVTGMIFADGFELGDSSCW